MRRAPLFASLLAFAAATACGKKDAPAPFQAAGASPQAPASAASTVKQTYGDDDAGPPIVSLLHHTDAEITLSSRVDNPRDYPEHLVDGKPATAWNGKTGDLKAWIEVKLDPRVWVTAIEITAGFDKGDLFEKNHRIQTLGFDYAGARTGILMLVPSKRELQRFEIGKPGGTMRFTVESSVPGTEAAWKEIVVSELRVLGTAPPSVFRAESRMPKMKVAPGSAPPPVAANLEDVTFEGREGASLEAICRAWREEIMGVVRREQKAGHGFAGYREDELVCKVSSGPQLEGRLPHGWTTTSSVEIRYFGGVAVMDEYFLLLKRADGTIVIGPMLSTANDIGDSPTPGFWRAAMGDSKGQPVLLVSSAAAWHSPYDSREADALDVQHTGRVCRFEPTKFTCDERYPTIFWVDKLDGKKGAAFKAAPRAKLPPIDPVTGKMVPWK